MENRNEISLYEVFGNPETWKNKSRDSEVSVKMLYEDVAHIYDLTMNAMKQDEAEIKPDNVRHPSHYADHCSVECIDIIRLVLGDDGFRAFCLGNALKYLWRHKFKNGEEDLEKGNVYLCWLHDMESEQRTEYTEKMMTIGAMFEKAIGGRE